jgi:hypothetical protein
MNEKGLFEKIEVKTTISKWVLIIYVPTLWTDLPVSRLGLGYGLLLGR